MSFVHSRNLNFTHPQEYDSMKRIQKMVTKISHQTSLWPSTAPGPLQVVGRWVSPARRAFIEQEDALHWIHVCTIKWMFPKIGVPQNGLFIMENPIKMDDLGVPQLLETPKYFQKTSEIAFHRSCKAAALSLSCLSFGCVVSLVNTIFEWTALLSLSVKQVIGIQSWLVRKHKPKSLQWNQIYWQITSATSPSCGVCNASKLESRMKPKEIHQLGIRWWSPYQSTTPQHARLRNQACIKHFKDNGAQSSTKIQHCNLLPLRISTVPTFKNKKKHNHQKSTKKEKKDFNTFRKPPDFVGFQKSTPGKPTLAAGTLGSLPRKAERRNLKPPETRRSVPCEIGRGPHGGFPGVFFVSMPQLVCKYMATYCYIWLII